MTTGRLCATSPKPGSPEWWQGMSASKIAAVVGLSPYESRFSLWHRMAGFTPPQSETTEMRRGHYLEPAIAAWFADQHPDFTVTPGVSWMHPTVGWATAAPDRMLTTPNGPSLLEVKADDSPDWDPKAGTIPPGYMAQVQWQLMCAGLPVGYVACLGAYLRFNEYVVPADTEYQAWLLAEATDFMDSLPNGAHPRRPNIDGHTETYETIRKMHPEIDPVDVELPEQVARDFCLSRAALAAAEDAERKARAEVLDALGGKKKATYLGSTIATRQPNGDRAPKLVAGRNLPDFNHRSAA
jgi:putative phage-type endonuclease